MRKIYVLSTVLIALVFMSFADDNARKTQKTCEYEFYVKCKGSDQFVEVIRAKDGSTAKTMAKNRYKDCDVRSKSGNGMNCK